MSQKAAGPRGEWGERRGINNLKVLLTGHLSGERRYRPSNAMDTMEHINVIFVMKLQSKPCLHVETDFCVRMWTSKVCSVLWLNYNTAQLWTINYLDGWTIDSWVNLSILNWCARCTLWLCRSGYLYMVWYDIIINHFGKRIEKSYLKDRVFFASTHSLSLSVSLTHDYFHLFYFLLGKKNNKFIDSNKSFRIIKNFDILWFESMGKSKIPEMFYGIDIIVIRSE